MARELVYLQYEKGGKKGFKVHKYFRDESLLDVSVVDNAGPYLSSVRKGLPERVRKALGTVGWMLQGEMKRAVKDGGPIGENWPELSGIVSRPRQNGRGVELYYRAKAQGKPYGRMAQAIGYYRHELPELKVSIGWLSLAAAKRGEQLQRGFTKAATRKQRWLFTASARWDKRREFLRSGSIFPMKKKSITVPGRNLVAPVYERYQQNIRPLLESKLKVYMRKNESWFQMTRSNAAKAAAQRG
jgi:hypothetical protein